MGEKESKTTITPVIRSESKLIENMIERRRRIEKEKKQPGYFKYNITPEKAIDVISTFAAKGYPEDVHLNYTILNCGRFPFECTTGLLTHLIKLDLKKEYAISLGLGLLPFLDVSNPCIPEVGSESNHSIPYHKNALDRWYTETMTPNQVYFCPGDSTHIRVIQIEGLDNIHVWYPKGLSKKVEADNVGSKQMQQIRMSLRGHAVVLMGKNTMMRKAIRGHLGQNPKLEQLLPHIVGNVGFVFTKEELVDIRDMLLANKVKAPARAGAIAPLDVTVPAQNT